MKKQFIEKNAFYWHAPCKSTSSFDMFLKYQTIHNERKQAIINELGKKNRLLYFGAGPDIFVHLADFNDIVSEFYFVDNDMSMNYKRSIMLPSFRYIMKKSGFPVLKKKRTQLMGEDITICKVRYQGKPITFTYMHCDWRKALKILYSLEKSINIALAYDSGGEGGSHFCLVHDTNRFEHRLFYKAMAERFAVIYEDGVSFYDGEKEYDTWRP